MDSRSPIIGRASIALAEERRGADSVSGNEATTDFAAGRRSDALRILRATMRRTMHVPILLDNCVDHPAAAFSYACFDQLHPIAVNIEGKVERIPAVVQSEVAEAQIVDGNAPLADRPNRRFNQSFDFASDCLL